MKTVADIFKKKESRPGAAAQKKNILPGAIAAGLLVSVIVYAVMLNAEKNALKEYEKGTVFTAVSGIPSGTLITAENCLQYFAEQQIDVRIIPGTAVKEVKSLENLIPSYDIEAGTIVTAGMFEALDTVTAGMEEPCIAGFKADDLYEVAGGILRAGDRIHIYSVGENNETRLIRENVYIQGVFDQNGNLIGNDDTQTAAQRVNIYLDRQDVEAFYSDLAKGTLRAVKKLGTE